MTNNVEDEISKNYKPLIPIPEHILTESSIVELPKPFEALFTKEHSLKYALMESLSTLSPIGEYIIPTQGGQKRYIDIYCSAGKNRYGIEVKISVGEMSKEQMDNYFGSLELDFIYKGKILDIIDRGKIISLKESGKNLEDYFFEVTGVTG